ncbi:hypothetical protein [Nitrosospira multiformis]|nr:hypothetical protein [Nitrosospira multiformis]
MTATSWRNFALTSTIITGRRFQPSPRRRRMLRPVHAGYELVCVSAIEAQDAEARLQNLRHCGFPIERMIATDNAEIDDSPKAAALRELQPVVFVDDFLPYLRRIPDNIHAALILREQNGSPNVGANLVWAHSRHADLADFTLWWLNR